MSNKARWEYFRAIYGRYQKGDRKARQAILNEFCLNTGYHRKYAIRLLNGASPGPRGRPSGVRRKRALRLYLTQRHENTSLGGRQGFGEAVLR